jgi:uncharacterized membrane protein
MSIPLTKNNYNLINWSMKDDNIKEERREKAKKITTFIISIFWYLIINLFLYFIDFQENGRIDWAY